MHRCLVFVVALCLAAVLGAPSVVPAQSVMVWKAGTATAGATPLNSAERSITARRTSRSPATGTASRRCERSLSGPVSSLPGIKTMIAKTKRTAMAPA